MAWPYPTSDDVSHLMEHDVHLLRDRIDQLLEERANRELPKVRLSDKTWPASWKLTPAHARLLEALMATPNGRVASKEYLFDQASLDDDTHIEVINVQICKMRKTLTPQGITITTHWGRGYSLDPVGRAILEAL